MRFQNPSILKELFNQVLKKRKQKLKSLLFILQTSLLSTKSRKSKKIREKKLNFMRKLKNKSKVKKNRIFKRMMRHKIFQI